MTLAQGKISKEARSLKTLFARQTLNQSREPLTRS